LPLSRCPACGAVAPVARASALNAAASSDKHARGQRLRRAESPRFVGREDRAHAGRAAGAAIAALHQFARAREQFGLPAPQRFALADAAGKLS
jgi:hypothetical protein